MAALDDAIKTAEQNAANRDSGMADLFGDVLPGPESGSGEAYARFLHAQPWSDKERLGGERDTLGLYITGHPIDEYQEEVRRFAPNRIADLRDDRNASQVIVGLVMETRTMNTQRGTMGIMKLDDSSGQIEVTLFSDTYTQYRELMVKDTIVIAEGRISVSDKTQKLEMRANSLRSLEQARQSYAQDLTIEVDAERVDDRFADLLEQTLASAAGGNCPVSLIYRQPHNSARIRLGERWQVIPSDDLIRELRTVVGTERVFLQYQ
jgi:DNA polymerase-3 subunit alpha